MRLNVPFCGDDNDNDPSALSVELAQQRILQAIKSLATDEDHEYVGLRQSLDRVLAQDVIAKMNVPPHANSAMDGYALSALDLPLNAPKILHIIGSSLAGHRFKGHCDRGQCVRIMTGGVMPEGTDTVIPQEWVELIDNREIRIDARTKAGDNVRSIGEDLKQGQVVLKQGRRITPADMGVIASLGYAELKVMRKLRVAFFSTGDELRGVGDVLQGGEIYDSNRYTLYGLLTQQHCQITDLGVIRDDPTELSAVLQAAALTHDVIISTGGVSVGEADYVKQVLTELGTLDFWKVAMKPGRPLTFGKIQKASFFGLPGNPVAVMVNFSLFVQPALQRLAGETLKPALALKAITTSHLKKHTGRAEYQRGILSQAVDGSLQVSKTGNQGSGILQSMSLANCYIRLTAEQSQIAPGSEVMILPFSQCFN